MKTIDSQDIVYITLPPLHNINVTFDNLNLIVPNFIPSPVTQVLVNEYIKNSFSLSFDSWTTDRRDISRGSKYQLDIRSSVKVNSQKHLIAAHQTAARSGFANKAINVSVFDLVEVGNILQ